MSYQSSGGYSDVKSHSSVVFNERINILFTMLDAESIDMGIKPDIKQILKVKSILETIWDNLRPLVFYAPGVRAKLNLNTTHSGIYTIDVGFYHIQECINDVISKGDYAYTKLVYIIQQVQSVNRLIKTTMQFFSYFIRPDYKQMPDFDSASERYKSMGDSKTIEQLESLIGKRSKDIFDALDIPIDEEEVFGE